MKSYSLVFLAITDMFIKRTDFANMNLGDFW